MDAIKYHELSDAKDVIEIKAGIPLKENVEHPEAFIYLANGKKVDGEYIPEGGDLIVFRSVPGYSAAVIIVFAAIAIAGAAYAGYQSYQMRKQAEEMEKAMRAMNEGVVSTPMLRGATNQSAKDKFLPFIIGRNFFTPYKLVSGWKEIEGQYQEYYNIVLQCGSNQQVLETLSSDDVIIKTFSGDAPQSGTFTLDEASPFYTAEAIGEVVQNGADFTESRFNRCVKMIQTNVEVKKTDEPDFEPVILSLPFFAKGVDICLQFDGLRYYTKDGDKRERAVSMKIEESLDGGTTWADASIVDYASSTITISGNTNKQFFKVLKYRKTYSEVKDLTKQILIRITGLTASYDGTALDRVIIPWQTSEIYNPDKSATANNFVDEIIIDTPERAKSTLIGLRIKTTDSNANKLNKLNIVTNGIARTWSGTEWSAGKSVTSNPAAWLLEVLTTSSHPPSRCTDSELDLDAFGELYEYCEDEGLTVNFVITEGDTKENILKKICGTCFAAMYRNYAGKISVTFDGVRENAISVFNTQNVISFKNVKEIGNITDGIRVSYLQADAWDMDSSLVMRPGAIRDGNAIIRDMSIEGVTNYDQAVYIARRIMAQELYRQKNVSVKVGQEGAFYAPLEKVLVQHPSLKIGLGSAEIKSIIMSGDNIIGFELYEPVYYDSADANGFGVVIQCISDTYCTPLSKAYTAVADGYVTEISFTEPIDTTTAPVIPFVGDNLSYGYLNAGAFDTITSEMLITEIGRADNGYELKLVDYNPDIYVTGAYPEYTPNITQPITPGTYTAPPATIDDIAEAIYGVAVVGDDTLIPDTISLVQAVATQNGIEIVWAWSGAGIKNNIKRFIVELTKNGGTDWTVIAEPNSNTAAYSFYRTVDGYPEPGDLSAWSVRVKAENIYGITSIDWGTSAINTTHYKTWIMSVPAIHAKASGRSVDIKLYKENDFYGDYEFRVQISKDSGANWNELGDSSLAWIDESSYKGPGEYTELIFEAYRQVLPLTGQASDEPVDTEYWYRVALYHKQTKQTTTYTTPFIVVCKPSSAKDLVSGAVKNAQLATGAVTHDKIAARTIQTENLFVTARSKINTLSNADDGISGWTRGTRFADSSRFGLELVAPLHDVACDPFIVEPNEVVEVSFGLQLVDPAGATGYYGVYFGCTLIQTVGRYSWSTTTKKWEAVENRDNSYFISNYRESDILFVKSYILGSNVNIKDVPAPAVSTAQTIYCIQLLTGDTTISLRSGFNPVPDGYTWRLYQPMAVGIGQSKIVAEQIEVKNLSAINSHLGEINGDSEDYKLVMGSGGSAEEGTLLLGAITDESYLRRWKEGGIWKMALKLASFIVDAVSSKVLGTFQVRNSADTATHLTVDNTSGATIVSGGGDVSLTAGTGMLLVGDPVAGHLAIDTNEIQAKASGTTAGTLYLQNEGGRVECGEDLKVTSVLTSAKAQIANTFIGSSVYLTEQAGFLIKTNIPPTVIVVTHLEFTMNAYGGGYPCIGIVQCQPRGLSSDIRQSKYSAIGGAPSYCRIFFTDNVLCFWMPKTGNFQTLHPVLHTNLGPYKIVSTTAASLPASRDREVTANVLLPWSSINDGSGSGLDADLLDGQHGSYYAPDSTVVKLSGNQTIGGIKTFSTIIANNGLTVHGGFNIAPDAYTGFMNEVAFSDKVLPRIDPTVGSQSIAFQNTYTPARGWYSAYINGSTFGTRSGPFSGEIAVENPASISVTWAYHKY